MSTLVLSHTDRLLRFGHELVFNLCKWYKVEVKVLRKVVDKAFEVELAEDVITLMTVFSARLYGKISHQNRKKALA